MVPGFRLRVDFRVRVDRRLRVLRADFGGEEEVVVVVVVVVAGVVPGTDTSVPMFVKLDWVVVGVG